MTEYLANGEVCQPQDWAMDWTIQLTPCNILIYLQISYKKLAIQITSGQLIGLSS